MSIIKNQKNPNFSKRKEDRLRYAENVCREVRYYISNNYSFNNMDVMNHLKLWMKVAPKNKYDRAK